MLRGRPKRTRRQLFQLQQPERDRTPVLLGVFVIFCAAIIVRLFYLQVLESPTYIALAAGQRSLVKQLAPERGEVFVRDINSGEEYPLAANRELEFLFAIPRDIENVDAFVAAIAEPLKLDQPAQDELKGRLHDKSDLYEPIKRQVDPKVWEELKKLGLKGIDATPEQWRMYPEGDLAAQVIGYVGFDTEKGEKLIGQYGIEGYFNDLLAGKPGQIQAETDGSGRRIVSADSKIISAEPGADVLLTIDRSIQHLAQEAIKNGVKKYQAQYGDLIVMDPASGDVLAMASAPAYDPNKYGAVKNLSVFKNTAIFDSYEPGSTFKPIIMASALDAGLGGPESTLPDSGCRRVDQFRICNFDERGPGIISWTGALERSSNVAMSQIAEKVGRERLYEYLRKFGLDALTGITLDKEAEVSIAPYEGWPDSQLATIGFGQGIATTMLHLISAEAVFANDGHLMEPHIVKEIRHPDGRVEKIEPKIVSDPIKPSTALTLSAMMVSAVENGVADQARIDDYIMAGKTGTAQVAGKNGTYDGSKWIASYLGYGPIPNPKVVIMIRYFNPKTSIHGANTAAPTFKDLAPQVLHYLRIPPNRESKNAKKR